MAASNERTVTVFGGTGFLGRRVARHLRTHGFSVRIASRHPNRGMSCLLLMIRNFNRSKPTFTMSVQSPMSLLALMPW
jgi:nucleoside-diphosphate-sugar epimerase